ncbi:MAG: hypothetical protein AB7F79_02670 [Steroidobacteraceae bacterium]
MAATAHSAIDNTTPADPAATALADSATPIAIEQVQCLPDNKAFLRARLNGSINSELSWNGTELSCTGSVRPDKGGLRLRFSNSDQHSEHKLVLLFGITGLKEGSDGKALPTNLTIMVENDGEFYATQGDNKCTVDTVQQVPLLGIPLRQRAYQVTARGFCTQPARALNGDGAVLVSRFDFAGRVDFDSDESTNSQPTTP